MTKKNTIAYVEFGSTGHRPIWIKSVIEAFQTSAPGKCYLDVWVPREFCEVHEDWCLPYLKAKSTSNGNIRFKYHEDVIPHDQLDFTNKISRFEVISRCVEADNADACFVANNLDACVKSIAFSRPGNFRAKLVGVLDQPCLHYRKFSSDKTKKWFTLRKYISEYIKNYLMCHRRYVAEILMLDHLAPEYFNRALFTSKYRYLPEFVSHIDPILNPRKHFGLPLNRYIFLLPGSMARRKGAFEFLSGLEATFHEWPDLQQRIAIVFAGIVASDFQEVFYQKVSAFRLQYPGTPLLIFNRFLADEEFINLISVSDIVCIPYVNFIGTSGILMQAANHGRPVLASEFGLLGELVRRYELGEVCDESNEAEMAVAIRRLIEGRQLSKKHGFNMPKLFARTFSVSLDEFGERVCETLINVALG